MRKYIQLQVNKPCQEKWDNMIATSTGNFCRSCNKTVIDFTGMTDNQLMEYFKNHQDNTCGRFNTDQLGKEIEMPVKRISWLKYFLTISFPAMMLSFKSDAQRFLKKQRQPMVMVDRQILPSSLFSTMTIKGCIKGEKGEPVPFASIVVKGTQEGTAADSSGEFTLRFAGAERVIEISAVGYEKQLVTVNDASVDIRMKLATAENLMLPVVTITSGRYTLGGMVCSRYTYSIWRKPAPVIPDPAPAINFFPNPVKRNGLLTIHFKKTVRNNQQIIIYNSAGILVQKETPGIDQPINQTQINLHLNSAGYFIIQVIDSKSKNKTTAKLIVE